jgi:hypothetical protein
MDTLVSRALMIRLSLHPSPASETSAFNKIRPFSSRCAGLFPFRISFFGPLALIGTQPHHISLYRNLLPCHIPSAVNNDDKSDSPNPFETVEAGD